MKLNGEITITIGGVSVTINAIKGVFHISVFGLVLSFCALIMVSAIDVVPSKLGALECIFYCVAATFVVSFVVALVSGCYCRRMKRKLGSSDMIKVNLALAFAICVGLLGCKTDKSNPEQLTFEDHCAAIRSLTLEARHYDRMPTVDLLMDLVKRGNDKLQETGRLPFGLIVTTRSGPMPTPSEVGPLDMPSLSIFDSLAYAAHLVGLELGFRGKDLLVHP